MYHYILSTPYVNDLHHLRGYYARETRKDATFQFRYSNVEVFRVLFDTLKLIIDENHTIYTHINLDSGINIPTWTWIFESLCIYLRK